MPTNTGDWQVSGHHELRPYYGFKSHTTAANHDTEVVMLDIIRSAHPDSHITPVSEKECDFVRWAAAGHAVLTLKRQDNQFVSRRKYHAPESRVRGDVGSLGEHVTFGEFDLEFRETSSRLYSAEWVHNIIGHRTRMFYLLSPHTELNEDGYCTTVDDLLLTTGKWTSELHDEVYVFDRGEWEKEASLWKAIQSSHWDDLILDPATKQSLIDDVQGFFNSRATYREYSAPWKRGIIFHGPPGNGKTMTIKALANSLDQCEDTVATLIVKSFETCQGPQEGIHDVFSHARAMAPCLLVFEDLDSLLVDAVRSYYLNEVDGVENNDGIIIIASTNHLERLDVAVTKRPSRFDRKYHFGLPSEAERMLYLEHWRKRLATNDKIDFDPAICEAVAKITQGFSFAYLKELMMQTLLAMARANVVEDTKSKRKDGDSSFNAASGPNCVDTQPEIDGNVLNVSTMLEHPENDTLELGTPNDLQANLFMQTLRAGIATLRKDIEGNYEGEAET